MSSLLCSRFRCGSDLALVGSWATIRRRFIEPPTSAAAELRFLLSLHCPNSAWREGLLATQVASAPHFEGKQLVPIILPDYSLFLASGFIQLMSLLGSKVQNYSFGGFVYLLLRHRPTAINHESGSSSVPSLWLENAPLKATICIITVVLDSEVVHLHTVMCCISSQH